MSHQYIPTVQETLAVTDDLRGLAQFWESSLPSKHGCYMYPCRCVVFIRPGPLVSGFVYYVADPCNVEETLQNRLSAIHKDPINTMKKISKLTGTVVKHRRLCRDAYIDQRMTVVKKRIVKTPLVYDFNTKAITAPDSPTAELDQVHITDHV